MNPQVPSTPEVAAAVDPMRAVLRQGLRTYRAHWSRILAVSALILIPSSLLGVVADRLIDKALGNGDVALTLLALATVGISSIGYYLLKGVIAGIVVSRREGMAPPSVANLAPRLPYVSMILTDLILSFGVGIGVELLVIPGILFGGYFGLAPIVAEVEHRRTFASLCRSRELVAGHFWMVATIMFLTLGGVAVLSLPLENLAAVIFPGDGNAPLEEGLGLLVAGILVKPIGAVASVELTLDLIAATDGARHETRS